MNEFDSKRTCYWKDFEKCSRLAEVIWLNSQGERLPVCKEHHENLCKLYDWVLVNGDFKAVEEKK